MQKKDASKKNNPQITQMPTDETPRIKKLATFLLSSQKLPQVRNSAKNIKQ